MKSVTKCNCMAEANKAFSHFRFNPRIPEGRGALLSHHPDDRAAGR